MTTSNQVYNIAKQHLGHKGSHARSYCGMKSGPYCCAFVTMCVQKAGGKNLFYGGKKCTYCPNAIKWCKANLAEVPPYLAMRMDFIFFDWQPNGTPDHIGFVLDKVSTDRIKTLEGNTSGGIVAIKSGKSARPAKYVQGVFRPLYAPDKTLTKSKLKVDSDFGYHSIYMFQTMLGTKADGVLKKSDVRTFQKKLGVSPDGSWGPKTSKKAQKLIGAKQDGSFGPKSVAKLQEYINAKCFPTAKPKPTTTPVKVTAPAVRPSAEAEKAVAWARKIAKSGKYTYKKWNNKKKNTKLCPICHPGSGNGWNCIGFCSAAYYHGAGLKNIECSCKGLGTDGFFTKVTLASWTKRNGKGWKLITNGGSKGGADISASKLIAGDLLICYDKNGKFHHIVLYTGNSKYIDCTNTSKNHIAERSYSIIKDKYHVTRAFRYTGK